MARVRAANTLSPQLRLDSSFRRAGQRSFEGHAFDPADPTRIFTIDIFVDGEIATTAIANQWSGDGGSGHGFCFSLSHELIESGTEVEVRLSNLGQPLGRPIELTSVYSGHEAAGAGKVQWLGGLRFSGSLNSSAGEAPTLDVLVDGERIATVKALGWAHRDAGDSSAAVRAFDLHLPERFADGCVHQVAVNDENGITIGTGTVPFVAFADGLAGLISSQAQFEGERPRADVFDRLFPMSIPFSRYDEWRNRFPDEPAAASPLQAAILLLGEADMAATVPSLEDQTGVEWVAAQLEGNQTDFDAAEARSALDNEAPDCAFVVFAMSGTIFRPGALARMAQAFETFADAEIVFGDLDVAAPDGGIWPLALSAFDYERLLEQGYCAHLFGMRLHLARRLLGAGASSLYRLFNSAFDAGLPAPGFVLHLPGALARLPDFDVAQASASLAAATATHLEHRHHRFDVAPAPGNLLPAARVRRQAGSGKTTVIIPTRNRLPLLRRCLESIAPAVAAANADVLIVDNDSSEPDMLAYLDQIDGRSARVLRAPGPFNFAHLNNVAVRAASGEYVCLLNNDIEAMDDRWLPEMLGRISDSDVGAVGATLIWPSGIVQHAGIVLGPSLMAFHPFNDRRSNDPGYGDLLLVAHECSAVTAACMLTRRQDYLEVSGMNETRFSVAFNDVDYCLKLRGMGKRIILTPHARLWHLESASRGRDDRAERKLRFQTELRNLREKWPQVLADDPYYNPTLSLDPVPYSALAWPPRSRRPRACYFPLNKPVPSGF